MKKRLLFLLILLIISILLTGCDSEGELSGDFSVHFIDVGQADAALVLCDGESMLIDGGNVADSGLMYSYLKKYSVSHLDYVVATHAHEDHVGGLAGALNYATVDTVYCPTTSFGTDAFEDFVKYVERRKAKITVPKAGDSFNLGGAEVLIISCNAAEGTNNSSIVLKITYGETSFLFTGDAERDAELEMIDGEYDLSSTVLKVGHHGSDTSTSYVFLREIMPEYAVISVGANNEFGNPTEDVLSRLRDADVTVYRTDLQGTVICNSNGKEVRFEVYKNAEADTLSGPSYSGSHGSNADTTPAVTNPLVTDAPSTTPQQAESITYDYVLNTNSKKFHYPDCSSVKNMKDKNKAFHTGTRDEVIEMGYDPCGNCKP